MTSDAYTLIPHEQLSSDALEGVIEEYINREGTDYGEIEYDFATKKQQVLNQLQKKIAFIVFDHDSQSVSVMHKDELA